MSRFEFSPHAPIFIEIGQDFLRAEAEQVAFELPLERGDGDKLIQSCRANLLEKLQALAGHKPWQAQARAFCAIPARGVSLRKIALPTAQKEEVQRLLTLQIEREFPVPPEQLAWAAQPSPGLNGRHAASNGKLEYLVAAVKRERLEEFISIMADAGMTPVFTLAAYARSHVCPERAGLYSIITLEKTYGELVTIEAGVPTAVRTLNFGYQALKSELPGPRSLELQMAGQTTSQTANPATFGGIALSNPLPASSETSGIARQIAGQNLGHIVYLTSSSPDAQSFAPRLSSELALPVEWVSASESTTTLLGLKRAVEAGNGWPKLVLDSKQTNAKTRLVERAPLKLAGLACGLLIAGLALPYAEALVLKPHVASKLAAIKSDQSRLTMIDRELDFLRYLKENEPPYLDSLLLFAKSAPPGTKLDNITMNRRGEVALRGSLRDGQMVADLRSKLVASGFFSSVAVEEQSPTPDRQKVNFRMTALLKPASTRSPVPFDAKTEGKPAQNQNGPPPPVPGISVPPGGPVVPPMNRPSRN